MNRVVEPVGPSEEGLDALLGAFFRSEMPSPWPAFAPPRARTLPFRPAAGPRQRGGLLVFSRLALAAAVAVLLLAAWLMPRTSEGLFSPGVKFTPGPGSADKHTGRELQVPEIKGLSDQDAPGKVKSSLQLEQKDGRGTIRIDVSELPPNK